MYASLLSNVTATLDVAGISAFRCPRPWRRQTSPGLRLQGLGQAGNSRIQGFYSTISRDYSKSPASCDLTTLKRGSDLANYPQDRSGDVWSSASALHQLPGKKKIILSKSAGYDFEKFLSQGLAMFWHKRCYIDLATWPAFLPQRKFLPVAEWHKK